MSTSGSAEDVCVVGQYAYVADGDAGLRIIDVSTPSSPTEVGFFDTEGNAYGVYVLDRYAYVADGDAGLRIVDISRPSSPTEVGFFDTGGTAKGIYVLGFYAYVADGSAGLRIIDVSRSSSPTEVGFYDTGGSATGVCVLENVAYVADGNDGLYILQNDLVTEVVDHDETVVPDNFSLEQNYPNPFNTTSSIQYALAGGERRTENGGWTTPPHVSLKIYNILGQEVRVLVDEDQGPGYYTVTWDGRDNASHEVSSGVYFYRLTAGGQFAATKRMILLR